jgi:hypothetical protein
MQKRVSPSTITGAAGGATVNESPCAQATVKAQAASIAVHKDNKTRLFIKTLFN